MLFNKKLIRKGFERSAAHYDQGAFLQREVANRLLERLDYIKLIPKRILDLGSGTGYALPLLKNRYPDAQIIALDFAYQMLSQARQRNQSAESFFLLCADIEALPLLTDTFDLILSNMTIQWCNDLEHTLQDCLRVLRPGGLLLFTTFGYNTLHELREAWEHVDQYSHVSPFFDLHTVGDLLARLNFADPVVDLEYLTLTYTNFQALLQDLKQLGTRNATEQRPPGLITNKRLAAVAQVYENYRVNGHLPASYEVIYGHALKK